MLFKLFEKRELFENLAVSLITAIWSKTDYILRERDKITNFAA